MADWLIIAIVLGIAATILGFVLFLRSAERDIRRGIERARRRHFHETGGGWTSLPWDRSRQSDSE